MAFITFLKPPVMFFFFFPLQILPFIFVNGKKSAKLRNSKCLVSQKNDPSKTTLHGLPKDDDVKRQWLESIFRSFVRVPVISLTSASRTRPKSTRDLRNDCSSKIPALFGPSCACGSRPVNTMNYLGIYFLPSVPNAWVRVVCAYSRCTAVDL